MYIRGMLYCVHAGGAVLGTRTMTTVTIARTGYVSGKFGFQGSLTLRLRRRSSATSVPLVLERTGGLLGNQIVSTTSPLLRSVILN